MLACCAPSACFSSDPADAKRSLLLALTTAPSRPYGLLMTNTATIALNNDHGLFEVEVSTLHTAMMKSASLSRASLQAVVEGSTGHSEGNLADCTWVELLIIWIESGNHPF
jgi:hypothetical protein